MAAAGTLIVTQDEQSPYTVFVRHQLSTDMTSVHTKELSFTADLDAISYHFLWRISPYIGIMNISERTLEIVRTEMEAGKDFLMSAAETQLAGPMLIDGTLTLLEQDAELLDQINVEMELTLASPFNYGIIKLRA